MPVSRAKRLSFGSAITNRAQTEKHTIETRIAYCANVVEIGPRNTQERQKAVAMKTKKLVTALANIVILLQMITSPARCGSRADLQCGPICRVASSSGASTENDRRFPLPLGVVGGFVAGMVRSADLPALSCLACCRNASGNGPVQVRVRSRKNSRCTPCHSLAPAMYRYTRLL